MGGLDGGFLGGGGGRGGRTPEPAVCWFGATCDMNSPVTEFGLADMVTELWVCVKLLWVYVVICVCLYVLGA